jgi:lipoate-protein ligase A
MALDEAIAVSVRKELAPPTLRLYGWEKASVSIGCFQKISDVDTDYCIGKNIPVVRRPTGGRAVLHGSEITYSFSVKTTYGLFSAGLLDSYKKISKALGLALMKTGISPELKLIRETQDSSSSSHRLRSPLCFQSISYGEISINSRKVIGSAQKRWIDGLLQQGSIPLIIDKDAMTGIFRLDSDHGMRNSSIGLFEISTELNSDLIKNAIRISFEETFNTKFIISSPSVEEITLAQELEGQKYLSHAWKFKR